MPADVDKKYANVYKVAQQNWKTFCRKGKSDDKTRINSVVQRSFEEELLYRNVCVIWLYRFLLPCCNCWKSISTKFEADVADVENIPENDFDYVILTNGQI